MWGRVVSASNRSILQAVLAADYDGLVRRLTRRFGSSDFASETLHEAYARLETVSDGIEVRSPHNYLFRTAVNVGNNRLRAERLRASAADIEAVFDIPDEQPGPAHIAEARSEMRALLKAIEELPSRSRQAFEAALFENTPYSVIATDLGVSLRTVERDIQLAMEHCARRVGKGVLQS